MIFGDLTWQMLSTEIANIYYGVISLKNFYVKMFSDCLDTSLKSSREQSLMYLCLILPVYAKVVSMTVPRYFTIKGHGRYKTLLSVVAYDHLTTKMEDLPLLIYFR